MKFLYFHSDEKEYLVEITEKESQIISNNLKDPFLTLLEVNSNMTRLKKEILPLQDFEFVRIFTIDEVHALNTKSAKKAFIIVITEFRSILFQLDTKEITTFIKYFIKTGYYYNTLTQLMRQRIPFFNDPISDFNKRRISIMEVDELNTLSE